MNLREGTGFDKPAKLPASLKGMCPEQIVALLIQTYRTAVEQRGIAYIDITIAEVHLCGLDSTDEGQRKQAANSLIGKVDWKGTTPFAGEVAQARTRQLSDEMIVTKEIVAGLLLAAGSRGFSGAGGGGSNSDLTNWDGTKKRSGWSR